MKIKIIGAVLTALLLVVVGYLIYTAFTGYTLVATTEIQARLIDLYTAGIGGLISGLSNMLWGQRGIDMIVQAAFIFVAVLAASVFFYEIKKE
jgi:RsiW-degrading membrane proteinase PrsW (M82 family)